jgi:hypothetical protein
MIGQRIECGARATGVALLGRSKLGPVSSIAWVARGGDMSDATFPLHEIEEREEHVPRHNSDVEDDGGHTGEETHFARLAGISGVQMWSKVT